MQYYVELQYVKKWSRAVWLRWGAGRRACRGTHWIKDTGVWRDLRTQALAGSLRREDQVVLAFLGRTSPYPPSLDLGLSLSRRCLVSPRGESGTQRSPARDQLLLCENRMEVLIYSFLKSKSFTISANVLKGHSWVSVGGKMSCFMSSFSVFLNCWMLQYAANVITLSINWASVSNTGCPWTHKWSCSRSSFAGELFATQSPFFHILWLELPKLIDSYCKQRQGSGSSLTLTPDLRDLPNSESWALLGLKSGLEGEGENGHRFLPGVQQPWAMLGEAQRIRASGDETVTVRWLQRSTDIQMSGHKPVRQVYLCYCYLTSKDSEAMNGHGYCMDLAMMYNHKDSV